MVEVIVIVTTINQTIQTKITKVNQLQSSIVVTKTIIAIKFIDSYYLWAIDYCFKNYLNLFIF